MSSNTTLVLMPGWRDSGPGHWQSLWAEQLPGAVRVAMAEDDWQRPKRSVWVQALARTILAQTGPVVVAAHSLGCIATTHLPSEVARRIRGALLVASTNDPYCPIRTAGAYARSWGSEVVRLQNAAHINVESGHGEWPLGLALLQSLMADHAWRAQPQTELESA